MDERERTSKRIAIVGVVVGFVLLSTYVAFSGTISATGWSQLDVVRFLTNCVSMGNEQKADFNKSFGVISSVSTSANTDKTRYNNMYALVSSLTVNANNDKTKFNKLFTHISSVDVTVNSDKSRYNTLMVSYSTLKQRINDSGNFGNFTSTKSYLGGAVRNTAGNTPLVDGASRFGASNTTPLAGGAARFSGANTTPMAAGATRVTTTDLTLVNP